MSNLINIFRIPELRWKICITLMFLAIYRVGYSIPLPFIDQDLLSKNLGGGVSQKAHAHKQQEDSAHAKENFLEAVAQQLPAAKCGCG